MIYKIKFRRILILLFLFSIISNFKEVSAVKYKDETVDWISSILTDEMIEMYWRYYYWSMMFSNTGTYDGEEWEIIPGGFPIKELVIDNGVFYVLRFTFYVSPITTHQLPILMLCYRKTKSSVSAANTLR